MGKTPFNIEIVACRSVKGITTYAMLRSGPTIKRHGVIKKHESNNNTLVDMPIEIDGKLYRAKLILEPEGLIPAKIPEPYES